MALGLSACSVEPRTFSPPPQRRPLAPATAGLRMLLVMTDDSVVARIVQDASGGHADAWRWTGKNPTLRVRLADTKDLKYRVEFALADVTLKDTGPVTLTFLLNGKPIGKQTYGKAGSETWEAPAPPELLQPNAENTIGIAVDKVWTAPGDGASLGIILSKIGLVRAGQDQ